MTASPHRPLCRYYGGKWQMAPWIVGAMPPHRVYTESFAGAASVLLRKPQAPVEILSDLDLDVVWLLRVAGHPIFSQTLATMAERTPYASETMTELHDTEQTDFVRRALRGVVCGAMTRSAAITRSNGRPAGYRDPAKMPGRSTSPADDWATWPAAMPAFFERLHGVEVLHQSAIETLLAYDGADTLHYVDPPYLPSARSAPGKGYTCDMDEADHVDLLAVLRGLRGMAIVSGYDSALYRAGLPGWTRLERASTDAGGKRRVEVIWLNGAAAAGSPALHQSNLFAASAA
ncbi:MAG TPA: DNA adenine methylase [Aurantimonas coralicida]|uniref:Site-specific DNA-methyltransferase (adenine-specific) n=1 Tax=marine sediment metagenome TaxID=412755 RepID=A0A0F9TT14_9ZZZZ|nr:DNA adenine methylase [Aurantimonas coralicida]